MRKLLETTMGVDIRESKSELLNALKVIVLDPKIKAWLQANDPMAFEQAELAIRNEEAGQAPESAVERISELAEPTAKVVVNPIDINKLQAVIDKETGKEKYEVRNKVLGIASGNGRKVLIDNEAVGHVLSGKGASFDLYKVIPGKISIMPTKRLTLSDAEIEALTTGKELTLKEFMGDRYQYNSRIQANEYELLSYLSTGSRLR